MQFRQLILVASALLMGGTGPALGQSSTAPFAADSGLQSLIAEALARNPTVAQRQAAVRAATLRIRPAGSLADPMLSVGGMDLAVPHFETNRSDVTDVAAERRQGVPGPGTPGRARAPGPLRPWPGIRVSRPGALRSTRPPVRFRSSGWERVPTSRSRRAMGTGLRSLDSFPSRVSFPRS